MKGGLNKSFKNTVSQSLHAVLSEGLQRYVRTLFLIILGTQRRKVSLTPQPIGHRTVVLTVLCLFVLGLFTSSAAKTRKKRKDTGDNRVYLLHSDELRYDQFGPNPDAQIVKGHVSFLHRGSHLMCDSAYFYQVSNSVRAFGHVRFRQGDTLSLVCDRAWYDGEGQMMEARSNVVLKHRGQTLYCDSLNYDRLYSNAYFFKGGRLVDKNSKLSSDWGEYNTETKQAVFYYDVQLYTDRSHVSTDTLYYDTRTKLAHVLGKYTPNHGQGQPQASVITSKNGKVYTENAFFNTNSDQAQLFGRSTVENQEKEITGDTLYYNSKTGANSGHGNVIYKDKKNKNELYCGHVDYNEQTGKGFATRQALLKDYSQGDTLYVHGDTLRIETFNINTDSVWRKVHCYYKVRAYRQDLQGVCDSLVINSKDSCMTMYHDPIVWNGSRQLFGEVIKAYSRDSTIREAQVLGQAYSIELMPDSTHYNQVSSKEMYAYFTEGKIRRTDAIGNVISVYFPMDDKDSTLIGLNSMETDTMRMYITPERRLDRIWTSKASGVLYPMTQIPPGTDKIDGFAWFDYVRPTDPADVFVWRGKAAGTELKNIKRHEAPLQNIKGPAQTPTPTPAEPAAKETTVASNELKR